MRAGAGGARALARCRLLAATARPPPPRAPGRTRARAGGDAGGGEGGGGLGPAEDRAARSALERAFLRGEAASSPASSPSSPAPSSASGGGPAARPGVEELALWRVQWSVLPGFIEALNVHVPHYVHMFEEIFRGPRPWRFGHLYLPGGTANLDTSEYALEAGSQAPLVGTVMEVESFKRLPNGRLSLHVKCLTRMRVLGVAAGGGGPFHRGVCEVYPDEEEVGLFAGPAEALLAAEGGGAGGGAAPGLGRALARAAACHHTLRWAAWETAGPKSFVVAPTQTEVAALPEDPEAGAMAASIAGTLDAHMTGTLAAWRAGGLDQPGQFPALPEAVPMNLQRERGVSGTPEPEALAPGGGRPPGMAGLAAAADDVWAKFRSVQALVAKLQNSEVAPVPEPLRSLELLARDGDRGGPPPPGLREFPEYRVYLRLSYVFSAFLPEVSRTEGRQAFLEAPSTAARLAMIQGILQNHERVLAAAAAVKNATDA